MDRRLRTRSSLVYWPAAFRFLVLLAAVLVVVLLVVEVGLVGFAYSRLGLSEWWVYAALAASLVGSGINLPVARLPSHVEPVEAVVVVFGVRYLVPAWVRTGETIVAVNVGGAVVPCTVASYLIVHDGLGWGALFAVGIVTAVAYLIARPVPGVGIVVPTLVPPVVAVAAALAVGGPTPAAVAFVAGTLGSLIGADLLHLRDLPRAGAPVLSIGGAGTFDGIFVTGVIAVLLAGA